MGTRGSNLASKAHSTTRQLTPKFRFRSKDRESHKNNNNNCGGHSPRLGNSISHTLRMYSGVIVDYDADKETTSNERPTQHLEGPHGATEETTDDGLAMFE